MAGLFSKSGPLDQENCAALVVAGLGVALEVIDPPVAVARYRAPVAWIETIPEDQWAGELGALYERVADKTAGRVDNIMQIHSLNPRALAAHDALYRSAMTGTATLRKVERELIALTVSLLNDCHY